MSDEITGNGETPRKPEGQEGTEGQNTPDNTPNANDVPTPDPTSIPPVEPVNAPNPEPIPAPQMPDMPDVPAPSAAPDLNKAPEPAAQAPSNGPDLSKPVDSAQQGNPPAPNYGTPQQPSYGGGQQQQQNYGHQQQTYDYGTPQNVLPPAPNATAVLVLGILSIVTCWCYGFFGLILGIIAIALASGATRAVTANPDMYNHQSISNLKTGRILAIIGLVLSILAMIIMIGWVIFIGTGGMNSYYY